MKQDFWQAIFISLMTIFFSSCSGQQVQPSPVITNTTIPSNTPQPTKTRVSIQTKIATPTITPHAQTSDLCVKNLVPAKLLTSESQMKNDKLIVFNSENRSVEPWGRSDIYTVNFDGSNLKRLTYYSGVDEWPSWSPDGKQILFCSDRNHKVYVEGEPGYSMEPFKKELFIMNVDSTSSRKVTPDLPYYPGRSPDGKYIVYTNEFYDELRLGHGLGDYLSNVFVENRSGIYKRNITAKFQPAAFGGVDWSPNGKHFAFSGVTEPMVNISGYYWPVHVYLANADGSNLQKLEGGPFRDDSYGYQEKTWSSDGKRLAFLTSKGIAIVNSDGGGYSEYHLKSDSYARDIFWLDDNQHLIFTDNNNVFYKIDVNFTNLEKLPLATRIEKLLYRMQLLKTRGLAERDPDHIDYYYELSPDGKWLAYVEHGEFPNNLCRQIRIINTETGESYFVLDREKLIPYLLKHSPNEELSILSIDSIYNTSDFGNWMWSPDGRHLLFTHSYQGLNANEYRDLFSVNLDGTDLHLIMDDVWYPKIQP